MRRGSATNVTQSGHLAAAFLISTLCTACDRTVVPACGVMVDTLETGRIVIVNPDPHRAEALRFVEEMRIGAAEGVGPDVFGNVGTLAVGANDVIYVGDYIIGDVKAFASDGEFLRIMVRRGPGPSAIPNSAFPFTLLSERLDRLWVGATPTLLFLDSLGNIGSPRYRVSPNNAWIGRADTLNRLYRLNRWPEALDQSALALRTSIERLALAHDGAVSVADSLPLERVEVRMSRVPARQGAAGSGVQLQPLPLRSEIVWDVDPSGDIWLAQTGKYRIHRITMSGDTIRTVELTRNPEPLVGRERDSVAEAAVAFAVDDLPAHKPLIRGLRVGRNGWLWVRLRASNPDEDSWDLFDLCGNHLGSATPPVPLDISPWLPAGPSSILGVTRDAFDVEYVVRLRIERKEEQPVASVACSL